MYFESSEHLPETCSSRCEICNRTDSTRCRRICHKRPKQIPAVKYTGVRTIKKPYICMLEYKSSPYLHVYVYV